MHFHAIRGGPHPVLARFVCYSGPVVGAERRQREAGAVVHVAHGVVGPGVAYGDGVGHGVAPDFDGALVDDFGVRPDEFFVLAGDGETL